MKTVTIVFVLQMLYLFTADGSLLPNALSPKKLTTGVVKVVSNLTQTVLPKCIFGANSVSFVLFTRKNEVGIPIDINDTAIPMDPTHRTVFIVHGFTSEANSSSMRKITYNWLDKEDINIFSLDWQEGACSDAITLTDLLGYPDAVQNTIDVGELLAEYTKNLDDHQLLSISQTTIVGHSLGAHVCGFAGKAIKRKTNKRYKQVIGLDPAGPLFRFNSCNRRLCETDGSFVQAFHTSMTLGMHRNVALVDFYFNRGALQPGCILPTCSHSRAVDYFASSLKPNCYFIGTPWEIDGESSISPSQCNATTCNVAGLSAPYFGGRGSLLVTTDSSEPYCRATTLNMS